VAGDSAQPPPSSFDCGAGVRAFEVADMAPVMAAGAPLGVAELDTPVPVALEDGTGVIPPEVAAV